MRILALDVATVTGWAWADGYGEESFHPTPRESKGMRFIKFNGWLDGMIRDIKPDLIVYEQPHARGGAANQALGGLVAILQKKCIESGIEYTCVHSGELKKFATGKGNANKERMIEAAKERYGIDGDLTDNEADALHIYHWALKEFEGRES
jgi:Holliday junction resolvasome RuvABC endonuclease subunit